MDKQGLIEIHIVGAKGNNQLSPDNFDIKEIKVLLESIEDLLYPNNKKALHREELFCYYIYP